MSRALFFYGTLCHLPLLEIVLGRKSDAIEVQPATLTDHLVSWVQDEPFPMIAQQKGAQAFGVLVQGLSETDVARFKFYEGGFEYDLTPLRVQTQQGACEAEVFFPEPGLWSAAAPWNLQDWVRDWAAISVTAAREVMGHFGKMSSAQIAHLLPFLRARAWSNELAKTAAPSTLRRDDAGAQVRFEPRGDGYAGFFRLDTFDISYPRFDGSRSETLQRAGFVAYDAALLLPYDPARDLVMLLEQLRFGPILRGDPKPWVLDPVAGLVDAGEQPIDAARREAVEEAGLELRDIRPMLKGYAAPGYSSEFFHFFLGLCDLDAAQEGLHGLASESEDIRTHVMSFERAMGLLQSGEINQTPLATMLLWLAQHRADIRSLA